MIPYNIRYTGIVTDHNGKHTGDFQCCFRTIADADLVPEVMDEIRRRAARHAATLLGTDHIDKVHLTSVTQAYAENPVFAEKEGVVGETTTVGPNGRPTIRVNAWVGQIKENS
jgi:hypothetical protein